MEKEEFSEHDDRQKEQRPAGKEKRRARRLKREVTVQYRIKQFPKEIRVSYESFADISRTKDLSEKGAFFTASNSIPPQTILEIKLQLPMKKGLIELQGRVVNCKEIKKNIVYGIGVEFINLKNEQRKTLREFINFF